MIGGENWQAAFLGILQGLTEFLPISSSAHLILLPWLFEWEPMGLTFDVLLHTGTLGALLVYFRDEWLQVGQECRRHLKEGLAETNSTLCGALLVGTLPALIVGGIFEEFITRNLRQPVVIVVTLSGFGLLLWWADRTGSRSRSLQGVGLRDGFIIGSAQALALIPGVSRSGITITAALFLGLSRDESARFSFLLGTPILALATLSRIYVMWFSRLPEDISLSSALTGVLFAFASGFLCIKYFLRLLEYRSYLPFVVYRLLLAGGILVLLLVG